ncbi:VWA domain-containing protein [Novosphingobium arvoryzae]|uniref:Pilus assembly protein TadG n=1 Tax=Novosphingobium arvoryzae TaxID=1256514 RepID=A0A918REU8_9SPHN|nr:VWA domain-containing protein [Novosphingobium arvoryzae]GGZ92701.1 pilus assembly protein TadG [Novosphingobium arvoryzae]
MTLAPTIMAKRLPGALRRLAGDRAGNTLGMIAAGMFPLLALVGGAIDMGRGYLAETRLQQACDAGVLAARKKLGSGAVGFGVDNSGVEDVGHRFFNLNFRDGAYGTENRDFDVTINPDTTIDGTATVEVPTTIMNLFGYSRLDLQVSCGAKLDSTDTDVMLVLDVTGSMNETNPGDTKPRIEILRDVILDFHTELENNKQENARIRYGFLPYSTNVNVGHLLKDEWVVSEWTYQSRRMLGSGNTSGYYTSWTASSPISGTVNRTVHATYAATLSGGVYTCPTVPANTLTSNTVLVSNTSAAYAGPPAGTQYISTYQRTRNGNVYSVSLSGTTCTVNKEAYTSYIDTYKYFQTPALQIGTNWQYGPEKVNVSGWRTGSNGCIEERDTYIIDDYSAVDLSRALDLNIDLVPTAGDSKTQWRPQYPKLIFGRAKKWDNSGNFDLASAATTAEYIAPWVANTAACPSPARALAEMDSQAVTDYVATLKAGGSTYHDIGMIWGARLLSPTGPFAAENANPADGRPTSRNIVFLTDGQTSALDISYSSYGFEPLDRRRWAPGSALSLTQTIEQRFSFACQEAKKKNITVWIVAFGTSLNPIMEECAGPGKAFQANDSDELNEIFKKIATSMSDLRLTL